MSVKLNTQLNTKSVTSDSDYQLICAQISADYIALLRRVVLPYLDTVEPLRLREVRTLAALDSFAESATSAQLTDYLRYDAGTVSRATKVLKRIGYVENDPESTDRRSPLMRVTKAGSNLAAQYRYIMELQFQKMARDLGAELSDEEGREIMATLLTIRNRAQAFLSLEARMMTPE